MTHRLWVIVYWAWIMMSFNLKPLRITLYDFCILKDSISSSLSYQGETPCFKHEPLAQPTLWLYNVGENQREMESFKIVPTCVSCMSHENQKRVFLWMQDLQKPWKWRISTALYFMMSICCHKTIIIYMFATTRLYIYHSLSISKQKIERFVILELINPSQTNSD